MWVLPQVLHVDLQVAQKELDFSSVLSLQKEAFIVPASSETGR